ncbi:hypothetical protein Tco_0736036, partial [Tanacetum coccineum]
DSEKEVESAQDYFVLLIWSSYSLTVKSSKAKNAGEEPNKHPDLKSDENPVDKKDQVFLDELERLKRQEQNAHDAAEALRKEFVKDNEDLLFQAGAAKASGTNTVNTTSTPVSTGSPYGGLSFTDLTNADQDDSEIPALEEIYNNPTDGIFTHASYDDEGAVADFTNLETVVNILVDLPYEKKAIGTKWAYRNKKDERGVVGRNKARVDTDEGIIDKTLFIKKDKNDIIVKTASTPIETQKPLVKDEEASDVDVHLYRSMIGSLMYLTDLD